MSVLACGRLGCENIMCTRLILEGTEYICDDCWTELLAHKKTWPTAMHASQVREAIEDFMLTRPGTARTTSVDSMEDEFRRLTGEPRRR